jgi:hypothetical protein
MQSTKDPLAKTAAESEALSVISSPRPNAIRRAAKQSGPSQQEWHALPDELQLVLAREAMIRAAATLADQAEMLALEMDAGTLCDRGGPDALRLFAAIIRATNADSMGPVGNA